jgi:hypothetical protein
MGFSFIIRDSKSRRITSFPLALNVSMNTAKLAEDKCYINLSRE